MSTELLGIIDWDLNVDGEGHRDYKLKWLVKASGKFVGPYSVFVTPGLPVVGTIWNIAGGNGETDVWAACHPDTKVTPRLTNEANFLWEIEQLFSTRPISEENRNEDKNPLLEPDRISGSFVKFTEEVQKNKDGTALRNSSHERIRGPIVEFDANRPTVTIERNLPNLPLSNLSQLIDNVNDRPMWGLAARQVKLSNVSWNRQVYAINDTQSFYYGVSYEFDINFRTFDRKAVDAGKKVLSKGGNVNNPKDFEAYKDVNGENTTVFLNGMGAPLEDGDNPVDILIQHYPESNLFQLGLPTSF